MEVSGSRAESEAAPRAPADGAVGGDLDAREELQDPGVAVLRPTLERYVPGISAQDLAARVAAALEDPVHGLPHRSTERHFLIWIPDPERRLWSPWLHLDVEGIFDAPDGSDAARLFGRFSPAPSLWTAVMFGLLAMAMTAVGGSLFAYSQWLVGESPWALWLMALSLAGILATLSVSRIGQARARHQMQYLLALVDRCA